MSKAKHRKHHDEAPAAPGNAGAGSPGQDED